MKVADFVINYLADKGIDKMFVVSGAANAFIIDAFTRTKKQSMLQLCMNRQQDLQPRDMPK